MLVSHSDEIVGDLEMELALLKTDPVDVWEGAPYQEWHKDYPKWCAALFLLMSIGGNFDIRDIGLGVCVDGSAYDAKILEDKVGIGTSMYALLV